MVPATDSQSEDLRFGDCVVRKSSREVFLRGVPQTVERRTFDVIAYLIDHRDRVVGKDELLKNVWGNTFVCDAAVTQCVMKARRALGAEGKRGNLIKTVHRVGYRFVGVLLPDDASPSRAAPPAQSDQPPAPAIAWLPTQDASGQPQMAWISLGLVSVAASVFKSQGVGCLSMKQLAEMFDIDAPSDSYAAQAALVRERAAGAAVVASRLVSRGEGFAFEWTLYFSGREREGKSNGRSPVELATRAAEEVLVILRGGEAGATANAGSDEELFYRDVARRAQRAGAMQALDKAGPLMAVCIDADDCSLEMYSEYLVVLAFQSDPLVLEHANKLIGRARAARSLAHEGWAYGCLMLFHLYEGEFALAEDYGNRALSMLRGAGSPAMLAKVLLLRAQVAARAGEYAHATGWLDEVARLEGQLRVPLIKGWEKQQRGVVALQQGCLSAARELFAEALALVQAEQAQIHIGWTSVFSGMAAVAAGEFDMARWHFDAGLAAADQSGHPRVQIFANLHRGLHCVRTGDQEGAARSAERLATRAFATIPLGRAARRRLEGMRQLALGRADLAVAALVQAMPELADYGVWWTDACWVAAAQTALIAGETESARGVLRFLQGTSNFERSNVKLATSCVLEGMLAYCDGDAAAALELFRRAKGFGVQTQLSVIIRFGLCWLEWVCTQSRLLPAAVAGTGDWLQQTAAGSMMKTQLGLPSAAARLTGSRRDAGVEPAPFGSVQLASAPVAATAARVLPLPL